MQRHFWHIPFPIILLATACGMLTKIQPTLAPALPVTTAVAVTSPAAVFTATAAGAGEATPSPAPGYLQTYRDSTAGFELDFPAGWIVDTTGISNGVILRSKKAEGPGTDGVPADVVKMDIVIPNITVKSLDELVVWEKQGIADSGHTVLEEQQLQVPSGLAAVRLRLEGALALVAVVNDGPVIIAGYGDLSRFDSVARTLRPALPVNANGSGPAKVADGAFVALVSRNP